jgi:hypothetical protein
MNLTLVTLGVDTERGQVRVHDVKIDPSIPAAERDAIQAVLATNGLIPAKVEPGLAKVLTPSEMERLAIGTSTA